MQKAALPKNGYHVVHMLIQTNQRIQKAFFQFICSHGYNGIEKGPADVNLL
jgi:hypothetical protein